MKKRYIPVVSYFNDTMGPLPAFVYYYGQFRFEWVAQIVSRIMLKFHEIKTGNDVGIFSCVATAEITDKEE